MSAAVESAQPPHWSPQVVEDLLFRRFIRREDVSVPPPPPPATQLGPTENYDRSTKMLFHYVRNGPLAALAAQNVNTSHNSTTVKGNSTSPVAASKARTFHHTSAALSPPTATSTFSSANAGGATRSPYASSDATSRPLTARANTPVQKNATACSSRAPSPSPKPSASSAVATAASPPPAQKRARVEWPSSVPSNKALCSSSRSKVQHLTAARVAAQENVDPDLIFQQNPGELPLHEIFASFPNSLKAIQAVRNASGDWRQDTFTAEEEGLYKKELGYRYIGPSQCVL